MVAEPAPLMVIVPFDATVATVGLEDEYETAPSESVVKPAENAASPYVLVTAVEEKEDIGETNHFDNEVE